MTNTLQARMGVAAIIVAVVAALTAASAVGTATASIDPGDEIAINAGM